MRTEDDIIRVRLQLAAELEVDIERIGEDPVWRTIASKYSFDGSSKDAQWREAFTEYVVHYVIRERFLAKMPCTNGPGTLGLNQMEVRSYGDHSSNPEPDVPTTGLASEGS